MATVPRATDREDPVSAGTPGFGFLSYPQADAEKARRLATAVRLATEVQVEPASGPRPAGRVRKVRVRKVSVSLPEELTAAVRERVGPGAFSQYVTEAVARRLELDLLAELAEQLEIEHGPVPAAALAEAGAAWPDAE